MQLQTPASTTLPPAYRQRRTSFARLSTIVNSAQVADPTGENEGQITINFPCMPDTIELARRANYDNLVKTPQNPDGQHQYMSTDPLEIPIEFAVNSYDEEFVGNDGPVALLALAARLHALTVPIYSQGTYVLTATSAPPAPVQGGQDDEAKVVEKTATSSPAPVDTSVKTLYPAPCILRLIAAEWKGTDYGITLRGFIRDARVSLKGPWLYGGPGLNNLPSSASYGFTFVHQPSYTNNIVSNPESNAILGGGVSVLAQDIYARFYNQAELGRLSGVNGANANEAIYEQRFSGLVQQTALQ